MSMTPGRRIAHYEITGSLGAGGMGEVYRARDTRLGRDVALKVLPDALASDPERRARFAREAKTLASLNHPHIAHLHGFEESDGISALVMELVDGEDLAARLKRGPIPYDEAIAIGRQIAQALEAAHDQGIVHRDLKPANVKLRDDGTVKVLDFGLAKALEPAIAGGDAPSGPLANSPTITSPAGVTLGGVILGTAAYMAPEQAKGRVVDKRADIWAFGCVLYEMLTGRRAFAGDDVSDTLASVLKSDVDWMGVPAPARRLLKKCLEKDPRKRLHDIGDAWDLLDDAPAHAPARAARAPWLPWAIASLLLASTIALAYVHFTEVDPVAISARFQVEPPPKHTFDIYLALSPDGRHVAFTARDESRNVHLWVRNLETLDARQLPGTEGAWSPFWSPDSRFLGFAVDRVLKKIDIAGGPPQTLGEAPAIAGVGSWSRDGTIVFGTRGTGPLWRIAATGGAPEAITSIDTAREETFHSFPFFLPDGRRFLYFRQSRHADLQGVYLGSLDAPRDRQDTSRLAPATMGPVVATSAAAQPALLFVVNGTLMAQPFDPGRAQVTGEASPIAERVGSSGSFAYFSASAADVLAYRSGPATATNVNRLAWLNRKGEALGAVGEAQPYAIGGEPFAIAPDGRHAMVLIAPMPGPDLWLLEFARGMLTRFTFHESADLNPVWSPDGARVVFRSNRGGTGDLYIKPVNGTTDETVLVQSPEIEVPSDWSRDGRFLLFTRTTASGGPNLFALPMTGAAEPVALLETAFAESGARFSPDGRWIAYTSNESGNAEIYLRPFTVAADGRPSLGAKTRVSTNGGNEARWRGDGKELFYRDRVNNIVAVDVALGDGSAQPGVPHVLFGTGSGLTGWDAADDGQRFLIPMSVTQIASDPITVVLNWGGATRQAP
jgi:Tol biopolymer transport system component